MKTMLIGFFQDDVEKFKEPAVPVIEILDLVFEMDMKILNLAVD